MGRGWAVAACLAVVLCAGCAGRVSDWIVDLRNSQGDAAATRGNLVESQKDSGLALALAPHDPHARAGLARVLYLRAEQSFTKSKLDDAEMQIKKALEYAPGDPGTQGLASEIEQARIRRDVVIANYPSYQAMGLALAASLRAATATDKDIAKQLRAFSYDYDPAHLTKAIQEAYALEDDVHRMNLRLQTYRSLVQSGAPKGQPPIESETPNLLPIP